MLLLGNDLQTFVLLTNIFFWLLIIVKNQSLKEYAIRKCKNCVKAKTETYKVQKPVPNTFADLCTLSVSICFLFQFLYIFRF